MKKMRNSKRGFTLTEIIVVIAIIVIVASAAFVGIAVVIDNAKDNEKKGWRDKDSRELFEVDAWNEVDDWTYNVAKFFDASTYTPVHTSTPTPTPTTAPTATPTTVPQNGSSSSSTNTPTPSPSATNTSTATPTPTKKPTTGGTSTNYPRISSATLPAGLEISGSDSQNPNNGGVSIKLKQDMTNYNKVTVTVTCQDNTFHHGWNLGNNAVVSDNGHTVTYEMEYNPYYKNPFQSGYELHPQWEFNDTTGKHTNVSVTVAYS